jgi:DNA invertase Pin-like site-specific DNA recombinase
MKKPFALTQAIIEKIKAERAKGRSPREIASKFGCHPHLVKDVCNERKELNAEIAGQKSGG